MPFEVEGGGGGLEYDGGGGGGLEDEGGVGGGGFEGQLGYRLHTWISAPQPGYRLITRGPRSQSLLLGILIRGPHKNHYYCGS